MFNIVLDKIMKELWRNNNTGATIGTKNNHVKVKCLAYADDLALLAETEEEAIDQINTLKEIAEKTGLQISYEKTELMTTDPNFKKKTVETKYGPIKVTTRFRYLGETICSNGSEKESMKERIAKLEKLSFATSNVYNKKNLSTKAKIRHYNTVVKPVILYGTETTCLPSLEKLLKIERRILRRIYGPKKTEEGYRLRPNREIYKDLKDLETEIRIRRLKFLGHMVRMAPERLNKAIFQKIRGYKSSGGYIKQMKEEMETLGITDQDCLDREEYRKRLEKITVLERKKNPKRGMAWTEERRRRHAEVMRERWKERRREANPKS